MQTHPPVGITHCCSSYFTHVPRQARESRKSLPDVVIIRTNVLQIYRVRYCLSVLKAWLYIDLLRALHDMTKAEAACVCVGVCVAFLVQCPCVTARNHGVLPAPFLKYGVCVPMDANDMGFEVNMASS